MLEAGLFLLIVGITFLCEYIDSGFGMGYGTILSPVLLIFGFAPLLVVPSVLISQAAGGMAASIFHAKFKNVDFSLKKSASKGFFRKLKDTLSTDLKLSILITILGVLATVFAAIVAISIPKTYLNTYIGILIFIMGVIMFSGFIFKYSKKKMLGVGILSAFNKGLSGGGFGPVVTSAQIICGKDHRSSVGVTTLSEVPICIAGFLTYLIANGGVGSALIIPLLIGSMLAAPLGAATTKKLNKKVMLPIIGFFVIILGIWLLLKTWMP